ncbi:MAG: NAD(P)H-dependent glycerol-3-phosphate dehydrogenase, partial [Tissierellia bacterium]|nr:NAD(P)H-dependent glycerol-3-phosphate dehydrogenase [Tissierellia bacterium]
MAIKVSVLGGGSWGTAIADFLAKIGHETTLYVRDPKQKEDMVSRGVNKKYLPHLKLSPKLALTSDLDQALGGRDILVLGVPSSASRGTLEAIKRAGAAPSLCLVNLAKGLEEETHLRMSQVAQEVLPQVPFVSLSGPSHAEELAQEVPTAVVAASKDHKMAVEVQEIFTADYFRVYTQDDLVAVEMGAALKNIIALAVGLSDGLGYGDNTKAALMTRGMYEITKLGIQMGGRPQTFQGLSGMGDLIVTCTSMHSRNRRFGIA